MKNLSTRTGVALMLGGVATLLMAGWADRTSGRPEQAGQPTSTSVDSVALTESRDPTAVGQLVERSCAPLNYFASVPRPFAAGCGPLTTFPLSPADVNGDGTPELWNGTPAETIEGCPWSLTGSQWSLLAISRLQVTPNGPQPTAASVAWMGSEVVPNLMAMLPPATQGCGSDCCGATGAWRLVVSPTGWLDCDDDGDLDLVLRAERLEYGYGCCWPCCSLTIMPGWRVIGTVSFWLENIGYERPAPPLAADLNHDGVVDGADLGILLNAWGALSWRDLGLAPESPAGRDRLLTA